ncbi:MAG TPA: M23 family metallopeptidase [Spongiibacteraceae bacterium]|jgi:murein DD-endopeptidase MepM/ murein hydrolase activator NlpD
MKRSLLIYFSILLWSSAEIHADELLELRGIPEQGTLVYGQIAKSARVELDSVAVRTTPDGKFVIGFDRDAKPEAQLRVIAADGSSRTQILSVKQRKYAIQRVTGVPQQTVEPPPEQLQRIRAEQEQVTAARAINSDRSEFLGPFQWPLIGPISGVYGSQRFYNGEPRRPHFGVDVAAPIGTPVRAPAAATVTLAHPDMFFSGGTLIMDHGYGVSSTFMHLSKLLVKAGDNVQPGQIVAEVGATGRASGPHLDWRINWFGVHIDPQRVAAPMTAAPATSNTAQAR